MHVNVLDSIGSEMMYKSTYETRLAPQINREVLLYHSTIIWPKNLSDLPTTTRSRTSCTTETMLIDNNVSGFEGLFIKISDVLCLRSDT